MQADWLQLGFPLYNQRSVTQGAFWTRDGSYEQETSVLGGTT